MPRVSSFYGIVIEMYYGDHPPPHFHARYGGQVAKIAIVDGEIIAGDLPGRALRLVREWLREHRDELETNWDRAVRHERPEPIEPTAMRELIHITDVEPLEGLSIRATFCDGAVKDLDLSDLLSAGGVFARVRDSREIFELVAVNPDTGTVEWPGEVDLDPEVLYGLYEPASGHRIGRRVVREPAATQ